MSGTSSCRLWPAGRAFRGLACALAPDAQHIVEIEHRALLAPQHEQRTFDLLLHVRLVVRHVDRGAGTIVLAHRVDVRRVAGRPQVFELNLVRRACFLRLVLRFEIVLGSGRRAQIVEPVEIRLDELRS